MRRARYNMMKLLPKSNLPQACQRFAWLWTSCVLFLSVGICVAPVKADQGQGTAENLQVPPVVLGLQGGSVEIDLDTQLLLQFGVITVNHQDAEIDNLGFSKLTFPVSDSATFSASFNGGNPTPELRGTITSQGAIAFSTDGVRYTLGNLGLGANESGHWSVTSFLEPAVVRRAFVLGNVQVDFSRNPGSLVLDAQLYFSKEMLRLLKLPATMKQSIGSLHVQSTTSTVQPNATLQPKLAFQRQSGSVKSTARGALFSQAAAIGADVAVGDLYEVNSYGSSGVISAFSVGTRACNVGDQPVGWEANTNQHPVIAQNLYRLRDGAFDQIGMSWLKHGFFAQSNQFCSGLGGCVGDPTGASLGVGCSDPYSANLNGNASNLGPRSDVNGFTAAFPFPFVAPPAAPIIGRRLQVHNADLDPALNVGAQYYIEACYVTPDDAAASNQFNNASYRQVLIDFVNGMYVMSISPDFTTFMSEPAILSWQKENPNVAITQVQLPDGERFIVAANVTALGGAMWRYDYAVFNLNSDRSAGTLSVPIFTNADVLNTTFHDVDYHSGEIFDGTDWPAIVANNKITWSTDTFATNANANAIRWGTMYSFSFEINAAPVNANLTLGMFKPGLPNQLIFSILGPPTNPPDCNLNGILDDCDINCGPIGGICDLAGCGLSADCANNGIPDECEMDSDLDGVVDSCDVCEGGNDALDADLDTVPDFCDACPGFDDRLDVDADTVPDDCDNCPNDPNPNQLDNDFDGIGNRCDPDFCTPVVVNEHFLIDPLWTTSAASATGGFWDWGFPAGDGTRRDPTVDFDGDNGCYLTENNIDTADRDVDNGTVILTSPSYELAQGNVTLTYAYWIGTSDIFSADSLAVQISQDQGGSWVTVATYTNDANIWQTETIDVSAIFPNALSLTVRFFATDAGSPSVMEAGIDAVSITIQCLLNCVLNSECDDGNVCTDDVCVGNICTFPNNTNFCNDSNTCTTGDVCVSGACVGGNPPPCLGASCTDCNGNGFRDDCEGLPDCNFDGIPDECQLSDCNSNGINDVCDIFSRTSVDCAGGPIGSPQNGAIVWGGLCINCHGPDGSGDFGPDIRNHSRQMLWLQLLAPTTHSGGAHPEYTDQDFADLQAFLSTTGGGGRADRIPDECQFVNDCDADGTSDGCALDSQSQHDADFDGMPDECIQVGAPIASGALTNRYLSFVAGSPSSLDPTNVIQALRLTSPSKPTVVKWVDVPDQVSHARLSCVPVYRDWGLLPIHIGDADVEPNRTYILQGIASGLDPNLEFQYSPPVTLFTTAIWGDVAGQASMSGWTPPNSIVNAADITAVVIAFRQEPNAPALIWADLHGASPNGIINASDILLVVNAFQLSAYPFADSAAICVDLCPNDAAKIDPGQCGCGNPDTDRDNDGTADCIDLCPDDQFKIAPGDCGCGIPDVDLNNNQISDCLE